MVHVYRVKDQQALLIQEYTPSAPIRSLELHGSLMFVGTSDSKLHLINTRTWYQTSSFDMNHTGLTVTNTDELLNIYKETWANDGIFYQALGRPYNLPVALKIRGISLITVS